MNSDFQFERRRGIVWVCDVQGSSSALNKDELVDAVEEYLPRLFWISKQITEAAGGEFIKWTGDGFLAWFECETERSMGKKAAAVFDAAWHLSFTNNATNLAVESSIPFRIRHGIAWEPDALVMHISHTNQQNTKDLLGQKIVHAFRRSGIPVDFPHIVTEKKLSSSAQKIKGIKHKFLDMKLDKDELHRYFKGEKLYARYLVASSKSRKGNVSKRSLIQQVGRTAKHEPSNNQNNERYFSIVSNYIQRLETGPPWAQTVLKQQLDFLRKEMLFPLTQVSNLVSDPKKYNLQDGNEVLAHIENTLRKIYNP